MGLAWDIAAQLGALAAAPDMAWAEVAAPLVASGHLDRLGKKACPTVRFLPEGVGTFHKVVAALVEAVQTRLEGQGGRHQRPEGTCPVVRWHRQRFLSCWKPAKQDVSTK